MSGSNPGPVVLVPKYIFSAYFQRGTRELVSKFAFLKEAGVMRRYSEKFYVDISPGFSLKSTRINQREFFFFLINLINERIL